MSTESRARHIVEYAPEATYVGLWIAILMLYTLKVMNVAFVGDFWEHVATIRHLAIDTNPAAHPLLAIDAPSALASPYAVLLASITRLTGLSATTVLSLAGYPVAVLLAVTLRSFVRLFTNSRSGPAVVLALTLVAWGPGAWQWSGFLHLGSILYVLPYPSTLALGVVLGVLGAFASSLAPPRRLSLALGVVIAASGWLVTLVHPYTAVFVVAGLVALGLRPANRHHVLRALAAWLAGSALAMTWPLFPLLGLASSSASYAFEQAPMYRNVAVRIAPALLGLIAIIVRHRRDRRDPLLPWLVVLVAIYVAGGMTGNFTLGRVLPGIVFLLHIAIAVAVLDGMTRIRDRDQRLAIVLTAVLAAAFALPAFVEARSQLRANVGDDRIACLAEEVPLPDVIMADPESSRRIPATGRRVVSWPGALPFVEGIDLRRADTTRFFESTASPSERREIMARWGARWILVDRKEVASALNLESIMALGAVQNRNAGERFVLIQFGGSPPGSPSGGGTLPC